MGKRFSYANVAATLALVFSISGGALAASHYLITSTSQIKPGVLSGSRGSGPMGPKGATGAAGPEGKAGPEGRGSEGKPGQQGPEGNDGASGTTGPEGKQGSPGATGQTGPRGPEGREGPSGLNGAEGQPGREGRQGPTGDTGATGAAGEPTIQRAFSGSLELPLGGGERTVTATCRQGEVALSGYVMPEEPEIVGAPAPKITIIQSQPSGPDDEGWTAIVRGEGYFSLMAFCTEAHIEPFASLE